MTTILLTGKTGQVGWELQSVLTQLGRLIAPDRAQVDLTNSDSIRKLIRETSPDIIVNAAAYTAVDKAESEPDLTMQINAVAPGVMGEEAKRTDALLVNYSTDYVFDGMKPTPYVEEDSPCPLNVYGRSKLAGERAIAESGCACLILRTSWVYSVRRGGNFVVRVLRLARERKELAIVNDQIGSPTWARPLAQATIDLLKNGRSLREHAGIYHLAAGGFTSRFDFANRIVNLARELSGNDEGWASLRPIVTAEYPLPASRPLNAAMSKDKIRRIFGIEMPGWEEQLRSCLNDLLKAGNQDHLGREPARRFLWQ